MNAPSVRAALKLSLAGAVVAIAVGGLAGCTPPPPPLDPPTLETLLVPDPNGSNTWMFVDTTPPIEVLPTRGRGVRINFRAPLGSVFTVALEEPSGTFTRLTENRGTPAPPEAGYFQIVSVSTNLNPPVYSMYVRAPMTLMDQANYDVQIVNQSLRNDKSDSDPMVVRLRKRKVYTVTVSVTGEGRVTSTPGGITCGVSNGGNPLTQCTYDFGPGLVALHPGRMIKPAENPGDPIEFSSRFDGWSGNCAGGDSCLLDLDGAGPTAVTATFVPISSSGTALACAAAPRLPGWKWIDRPNCATNLIDEHPGITLQCDAAGYFCCEPAGPGQPSSPRCPGGGFESQPDCRHQAPRGRLHQPGGCYEVDEGP